MKRERRLTPLRALDPLRQVDNDAGRLRERQQNQTAAMLEKIGNELADHIRAALTKKRRRRKAS